MTAHARSSLFWPGMDNNIRLNRAQCQHCNSIAKSQPDEPPLPPDIPNFPFQKTVIDIFHYTGEKYIAYADRFSGWLEIVSAPKTTSHIICTLLEQFFSTFGVPSELSTDGGPPFDAAEFKTFLKDSGIIHRFSSAYFPQSNGRAELAVKSAKRIVSGNITPSRTLDQAAMTRALLTYRNTPFTGHDHIPFIDFI